VRDVSDERQVRIHLTEKGRGLRQQAECIPGKIADCLARDREAIGTLTDELTRVRNTLMARIKP
jgi:DNA-binding MarR family transcriptional regulator